jgi:hypothetical protein
MVSKRFAHLAAFLVVLGTLSTSFAFPGMQVPNRALLRRQPQSQGSGSSQGGGGPEQGVDPPPPPGPPRPIEPGEEVGLPSATVSLDLVIADSFDLDTLRIGC